MYEHRDCRRSLRRKRQGLGRSGWGFLFAAGRSASPAVGVRMNVTVA